VNFTRLAWNSALADRYRYEPGGPPSAGVDLRGWTPDFEEQKEIYRFFAPGDCAFHEMCVGGPGWRKVVMFHTTDYDNGMIPLHIGDIPNFDGTNPVVDDGLFLYSSCHNHYHFNYYANFTWTGPNGLSAGDSQKRGFCLISYYRLVNSEWSPLPNPYGFCNYQGISAGWADIYSIGIPCQWKDVTNVVRPTVGTMTAVVNFQDLLCEGVELCEADGVTPIFVPTNLTTCAETVPPSDCSNVSKFKCNNPDPNTYNNNFDSVQSTIGGCGASYVTKSDPSQALYTIGPLRDTEFSILGAQLRGCRPNNRVTLQCTVPRNAQPQVIRVCESSVVLGCGLACRFNDTLANIVVEASQPATVTFTCPGPRDSTEPGGFFSLYQAMVIVTDGSPSISCTGQYGYVGLEEGSAFSETMASTASLPMAALGAGVSALALTLAA